MSFGFLKGLFGKREAVDAGEPDLRGPLDLGPGDLLRYYQHEYRVEGVLLLLEGNEKRHQYLLVDRTRARKILTAEQDRELLLTLQEVIDPRELDYDGGDTIDWNGMVLSLTHRGRASAWCHGEVPPEKVNEVAYREFEEEDEEAVLTLEHWGSYLEARAGELIQEGELSFEREGEERFELRAPVKLDLKALSEARRARRREEDRSAEEEARRELAAVREKLRRLKEEEERAARERPEPEREPENFLEL